MKFSNKTSFIPAFLLFFSATLVVLGISQVFSGTLRWYNGSEEDHEKLQNYPIYSADEAIVKPSMIRVFIAPKPAQTRTNVFVFLQNTQEARERALAQLPAEKVQATHQNIANLQQDTSHEIQADAKQSFVSPVEVKANPLTSSLPTGYATTVQQIVTGVYFRDVLWKFPLIVDIQRTSPRGQMTNESVILSGKIKSLSEMAKVLVHELGHMIDIYLLRSTGTAPDPSSRFYAISWDTPTILRPNITDDAFVSGYGLTNQYEDFAEAFTMYVFHNTAFAQRAQYSPLLQQKYDFLHTEVFGDLFLGKSYEKTDIPATFWDVTKIVVRTTALTEIFTWLEMITHQIPV